MKSALIFCLACLSLSSIAQEKNPKRPNILWIVCEDISPYLHIYGEKAVKTPKLDKFASESIKYNFAFTVAGVCAPSRSAIITGMYPTSIGTNHMRTKAISKDYMPPGVPNYAAVIPEYVHCFPEYLRLAGYYTTNNEKTDYQFDAPVTVWDENGPAASYKNRGKGQPFFCVFNLFITHESQLSRRDSLRVDPAVVTVPPFYEDTKLTRETLARNLTNIETMDGQVGEIITDLKNEGLYDNTIIFFFSDHGGSLPWMKREILDRGIHIPLIIHIPKSAGLGTENNELVSSVDFAPTVLSLAGIKIPDYMQGFAFLGEQKTKSPRKYIYAARDRMDEKYDRVRAVRDLQFEYLYNYMPEQPSYQELSFRTANVPMMKEMLGLRDQGKLNSYAMAWFKAPKAVEELYDTKNDFYELHNLATEPSYQKKLEELRTAFRKWESEVGDLSGIPESAMVANWWEKKPKPPVTATPVIRSSGSGVNISCDTKGASIGYRIIRSGQEDKKIKRVVQTWDAASLTGAAKNGAEIEVSPSWIVYDQKPIVLQKGDRLIVQAMRIGFDPSTAEFTQP
jgi:N-sulfoglucosamine sulfohydrolase